MTNVYNMGNLDYWHTKNIFMVTVRIILYYILHKKTGICICIGVVLFLYVLCVWICVHVFSPAGVQITHTVSTSLVMPENELAGISVM